MTDRVFEDDRSIEVSSKGNYVEVYVFEPDASDSDQGEVMITVNEDAGWNYQRERANFTLTAEEATLMKEFLIKKGY